ncbi:MAG: glycoside hydrolase family 108 protein [Magnetococcales bacterium]|nr:glycoside hydrolase family 108 protein [Magnetococcales bacterium]
MKKTSITFETCLEFVLAHEGGYSNDPNDPGGETRFGISKRQYPNLDIAHLTRETAADIYRNDYWRRICGDDLPPALAMVVFDAAVNQGVAKASRMVQESLGVTVDGAIGPDTLAMLARKKPADAVRDFMARRACHYAWLVAKNPSMGSFLMGWYRRCFDAHKAALELMA